jgi:type III restriction enzyme
VQRSAGKGASADFSEFERAFPCVCFALATGVGKTRLMGAFICWLNQAKGIRNFLVLAPNLTNYKKLNDDIYNPASPKYVFPGIGDFVHRPPGIITGENYTSMNTVALFDESININVFNISKINAETKGGKQPRIKRLSEYIGKSYFEQLVNLDDLVILMDESHHYRAERGMQVINELKPILGIELTATPKTETGGTKPFKNIIYQYGLGLAIEEGFVKEPAVATRKDFDPSKYEREELDRIKLEDAIRIHEDTRVALETYALDEKCRSIKPFVLVVTKDTGHASQIKALIQSDAFFEYYADKVIEIHSNQRGEEKEENIERLLTLEDPENKIEIVIHVNMLKEGWDVTNLYTIVPLRTSASETLTEQTIGRGLRLPYSKRTGNDKVDKLTIVAHDNFQRIIEEANRPDSIIKQKNIIEIDPTTFEGRKEVLVAKSTIEEKIETEKKRIAEMPESKEKAEAGVKLEIREKIYEALPQVNNRVKTAAELTLPEIKKIVVEKVKEAMLASPQQHLFAEQIVAEISEVYNETASEYVRNIIEIPRIIIQPSEDVDSGFYDLDLDASTLNYPPVSEEILFHFLARKENSDQILIGKYGIAADKPENMILNELVNFPEIDYDTQSDLLHKLVNQAMTRLKSHLSEEDFINVVKFHKKEIAGFIYAQMRPHFYCKTKSFETPIVKPFTAIEPHNLTKVLTDAIHHFTDTITPTSAIPQKVFAGFKKAYHNRYKFDVKSEKDFATILENDKTVLKWLRPAPKQFKIFWDHDARNYEPDFVVETADAIYLTEIKADNQLKDPEVLEKARAALQYCHHASEYNTANGGKPWKYLLIPHNEILPNMSIGYLAAKREMRT